MQLEDIDKRLADQGEDEEIAEGDDFQEAFDLLQNAWDVLDDVLRLKGGKVNKPLQKKLRSITKEVTDFLLFHQEEEEGGSS